MNRHQKPIKRSPSWKVLHTLLSQPKNHGPRGRGQWTDYTLSSSTDLSPMPPPYSEGPRDPAKPTWLEMLEQPDMQFRLHQMFGNRVSSVLSILIC